MNKNDQRSYPFITIKVIKRFNSNKKIKDE